MELVHYLTMASMKRRHNSSWEEKAFAEGIGFVWPPRSYSCSFCHREFSSAQALGGHMNVHRRDRARLKQSPLVVPNPSISRVSAAQEHKAEEKDDCVLSSSSSSMITQRERSWLVVDDRMGLKRVKVANTMMFSDKKCSSEEELDLELRLGNVAKLK